MMWLALLRRFWQPLVALVAAGLIWWGVHSYGAQRYEEGYQQAVSENAKALAEWQRNYDAEVSRNEKRLASARRAYELELAQLAVARDKPAPRVVCQSAPSDPGDMPATAGVSAPEPARAGPLPAVGGRGFDPTDRLYAAADEADLILAACRRLNSAVHGSR